MSLSLNQTASDNTEYVAQRRGEILVGFGIHEAFHEFVQSSWQSMEFSLSAMYSEYPMPKQPRYLRAMMVAKMVAYLSNPKLKAADQLVLLQQLKSLVDEYEKQFPQEASRVLQNDRVEGTALYAEALGESLIQLGCNANEDKLIAAAMQWIIQETSNKYELARSELYSINALASLMLRGMNSKAGWQERVQSGSVPLKILLEGVSPSPTMLNVDATVMKAITAKVKQYNKETAKILRPFFRNRQKASSVGVFIPFSTEVLGSQNATKFVYDQSNGNQLINVDMQATMMSEGKTSPNINIIKKTFAMSADFDMTTTPCGDLGFYTFIADAKVAIPDKGPTITLNLPSLQINDAAFERKTEESNGRTWICLK